MRILAFLAGGIVAALLLESLPAFALGAALGWLLADAAALRARIREAREAVRALSDRLERLERSAQNGAEPAPREVSSEVPTPAQPVGPHAPPPLPTDRPSVARAGRRRSAPGARAAGEPAARPSPPSALVLAWQRALAWATGGNPFVRVGVVVLFVAFAFLLSLAAERLVVPIEVRLLLTAATGLALAAAGWRLRARSAGFGLTLQGGGAALVYLTIFAAYRLYGLMPSAAAFGLLVLTTAACAALALVQASQTLALLALAGGFAAPIFGAGPRGSDLALFGYYSVLNGGVLVLAWRRPWRWVTVAGFLATFGVGGLWLDQRYDAALHYPWAQAFLIAFGLTYFAAGLLGMRHARRSRADPPLDATLTLGLPVAAFTAQAVLVAGMTNGLAWSALGYAVFYGAAAAVLLRRKADRLLVEALTGVGLVFGTLVIPFALDASWTGAGWAVEGAALVWIGARQRRRWLRAGGMALQVVAAASLASDGWPLATGAFVFNAQVFGGVALAGGALFTGWALGRADGRTGAPIRAGEAAFGLGGLGAWLLTAAAETVRAAPSQAELPTMAALLAATIAAAAAAAWRLDWSLMRRASLGLLPLLAAAALAAAVEGRPSAGGGWAAWPLALAAYAATLRLADTHLPRTLWARSLHAGSVWLLALLLAAEGYYRLDAGGAAWTWTILPVLLVPVALALALPPAVRSGAWPFGSWPRAYLATAPTGLLVWTAAAATLVAGRSADPHPLPYLPLLNPVDLALGAGLLAAWRVHRAARAAAVPSPFAASGVRWGVAVVVFGWLNVTLARSVHAFAGVPYVWSELLASDVFQSALTIFWTALGVAAMVTAARRSHVAVWRAAAGVLGAAVLKLFAVDLSGLPLVTRIGTFLVVGLFLIGVGYLAPSPSRADGSAG